MRITDRGWFRGLLLACIYTLGVLGIVASGGGGGGDGDGDAPDTTSIIINNNDEIAIVANVLNANLIASDNLGVTEYLITEHDSTDPMNVMPPYLDPLPSDTSWVAILPSTNLDITVPITLTRSYNPGDRVELCAWFMDAAGNVSDRVCDTIAYGESWEAGIGNWAPENGVWQVGTPTVVGPTSCFAGTQCAGTVLDGNYPANITSRLVSASLQLPTVTGVDEIHLRFQQWFVFLTSSVSVSGQVQVSVWDSITSTWGSWVSEGTAVTLVSGGWSLKDVDLTAYSGERVRIGFLHTSNFPSTNAGWYIDDITIVEVTPAFTGDFETGWDDWSAGNGLWQVGTPTVVGPASCFAGTQCAGTVLDGNYPGLTDSRLVSASLQLPTVTGVDEIHLRFQQWFAFSSSASGQVQVSVWDSVTSTWGGWVSEGTAVTLVSGGWSLKDVDLTAYSGERVRIGFLHTSNTSSTNAGWYIDDITVL